jgi:modification methylase
MTFQLEEIINTVRVEEALECMRKIPDECVDISVTSPPYNKNGKSHGWLVQNSGYSHYDDQMVEKRYQEWQINVLNELHRITKLGGSLFYNHKIRWKKGKLIHPYEWISKSDWVLRQEIVWDRTLAANIRGWRFWQQEEHIYWLYKPIGNHLVGKELESRHAKMGSIWQFDPVPRNKNHPAPFPIEIPIRIIYSMPGEGKKVVLDPFCGTGTTLVAAKILGHDYIGIDISPDYVEFTKQRLDNYSQEVNKAKSEMDKHVVNDPFTERKKRGTVNWPFGPDQTNNN